MAEDKGSTFSNRQTIFFIMILSFVCATILAILASTLQVPQEEAKELERSSQMLVAARIYNSAGYFQVKAGDTYVPAKCLTNGVLVPAESEVPPSKSEILAVVRLRIRPMLTDNQGKLYTFEEKQVNLDDYIAKNKKRGYANLPLKIVYEILPNVENNQHSKPEGYIIPVSGFGLWDYIYGYIALESDGVDVIGISWYEQKETPGLGANIAEAPWQSLFPGKKILQPDSNGKIDFEKSPIGITVVRGKVKDVLGSSAKAQCAVDGMAGATLTGNGVTKAYKDSLTPYRPFFIRLQNL